MSEFNWDERELEQLLEQLPKYEDTRSKQQLFTELERRGLFEKQVTQPLLKTKSKNKRKFISIGTSVAVAAVAAILFTFTNVLEFGKSPREEAVLELESNSNHQDFGITSVGETHKTNNMDDEEGAVSRSADIRSGLYLNEIGNEHVLYIGSAVDTVRYASYATKIPSDWIRTNQLQTATYLQVYEKAVPVLEQQLGKDHPLVGVLKEEGQTLIHELPSNHPYENNEQYIGIMQATFGHHYTDLKVQTEDGQEQLISLQSDFPTNVIPQMTAEELNLYVNQNMQRFTTIEEAIADYFEKLSGPLGMPYDVPMEIVAEEPVLFVNFKQVIYVNDYTPQQLKAILEGIIYIANQYGLVVKFNGIDTDFWGGFDFTQPIEPPLAPNELLFPS